MSEDLTDDEVALRALYSNADDNRVMALSGRLLKCARTRGNPSEAILAVAAVLGLLLSDWFRKDEETGRQIFFALMTMVEKGMELMAHPPYRSDAA